MWRRGQADRNLGLVGVETLQEAGEDRVQIGILKVMGTGRIRENVCKLDDIFQVVPRGTNH